ncbi:hypothetical protein VCRA2128O99_300031 [Vibrio crassostreae]|nr:hypothetical protein VCRA2128O103_270030 [Vibrio crassostreae]CAK3439138.1 hypothetical protein VCRA2128O104_280030 [Vibrio crassostreae]CAK3944437.1 hypothetical protein VCRA2128O99_300031 [Vibrio crassostreae]
MEAKCEYCGKPGNLLYCDDCYSRDKQSGDDNTPMHSINIDFSHSSEAKALMLLVDSHLSTLPATTPLTDEFAYFFNLREQLIDAVELLQSMEV